MYSKIVAATSLLSLVLSGCSLPTSGPRGDAIRFASLRDTAVSFCLIKASAEVVETAQRYHHRLAGRFSDRRPPSVIRIGTGDVVGVTLFESAAGGLFFSTEGGNRQGNFLRLPNQTVDERGNIFVPYAGQIRARGRTVSTIRRSIINRLKNKALEPQAIVSIVEQRDSQISVLGAVGTPSRFPVSLSGERVLDALARAGGISSPGYESWVVLLRKGRVAAAPFDALIHEPRNNIYIRPRDNIYVVREPQTFVVFGATTNQNHVPFGSWKINLAEAIGKASGLDQSLAEPAWVFLYRMESRKAVEEMQPDCAVLTKHPDDKHIPVVYQFDLREPSGYFVAKRMDMKNKDVLYAANARTVEIQKFTAHVRDLNQTVAGPINTAISAYALDDAIKGVSTATTVITSP